MNKMFFFSRIMHRIFPQLILITLLLGLSPAAISATIDSFTTGQPVLLDTTAGDGALSISIGDGSDTTMLGGARDSSIDLLSGPLRANITLIDSVGYFSMSVAALSTATSTIQWDGPDGSINLDPSGLQTAGIGVDLSGDGAFDAFSITTISTDHDYEIVIGVYTDSTHWTEISYAKNANSETVTDNYVFEHFIDPAFCNTTNPPPGINAITCGSQPADVTDVGAMQLIIDPNGNTPELDLVLDSIDTISTTNCFASIGDVIWNDVNRNGIQDAGEPGINGVTVTLKNNNGVVIATTTTSTVNGVSGFYEFKNNCAGDYIVEIDEATLPPGMTGSPINQGTDITIDNNGNPAAVSLPDDNNSDLTIDFGYNSVCTGRIGDFIWFDENRNGIQDAGEPGISGVTVNLKDSQNTVIATATTDVNGFYAFTSLCANEYIVEALESTLPPEYIASPALEGNDPTVDSNINNSIVTLTTDDDTDVTFDLGFNSPCTGRIGDYLWFDANRNGIQDAGESGIGGVTVNLKDNRNIVIATTTTDANGFYVFPGLCANDYIVEVDTSTLPADYVASPTLEGNDPTVDSNENSSIVTLISDIAEDLTIDFGYNSVCTGRIGDFIWFDANRNGIQDTGESGISGVTINLKDSQNTVIATTTTDVNGFYAFPGLCANDYIVEVDTSTLPADYVASPTLEGNDPTVDSNVNSSIVTLISDIAEDLTIDFGYNSVCTGRIGDYIWFDANRNGIQDTGESGIAGVTVNLKDSQNTVIATTTTDVNGFYAFPGLCANDYIVEVDTSTLPADYVASPTLEGNDPTVDSNVNSSIVTLTSDIAEDLTIDFGYNSVCTGRIGDYIWLDANRNGIQDAGESGIAGVTINLKDSQNTVIATTTTDANGFYAFPGLCANDYIVEVDTSTLPADYVASPTLEGNDPTVDSNVNSSIVTLISDIAENLTIDFGYNSVCTGRIGDYLWFDANRNGIQDAGESGIAGVTINLKDSQNTVIATTTTDANGFYEFPGLCANDYIVEVDTSTLPADYVASPTLEGNDPTVDSNVNSSIVTLTSDIVEDLTIDFGYNSVCTGRIGDFIWFDANRNGIQDAGEPGINGVTVNLKDSQNTVIATTTTDVNGFYEFRGLCANDYIVEADESTLPPEYVVSPTEQGNDPTIDSNINGSVVTLETDNDNDVTFDLGYNSACTGRIGDYLWFDENRNGIQDAGENGITGVTVNLKDSQNTTIATVTTDANGFYEFLGLCANDYIVEVDISTLPAEYVASPVLQGSDPAVDSNENSTVVALLTDSSENFTIDFGYNSPCAGHIGNYVWLDENENGIQDIIEIGISNVKVILRNNQNVEVATAMTNSSGFYEFVGLCAGEYRVEVDPNSLPAGVIPTMSMVGLDGSVDSNNSPFDIMLPNDFSSDVTIDFGYFEKMIPGDTCKDCDGKVTKLTLQYNGSQAAHVIVEQKKDGVVFDAMVQPGEHFTFSGTDKKGTLGTEISIRVNGSINARIHTSCSVDVGPGLVAGDFEVIEGYSRNGGLMCPIEPTTPPPTSGDCSECDGKVTMLTLQYNGSQATHVIVEQKKDGVVFDAMVQPGEHFTFSGTDKKGTLGTEISIRVNGSINARIHTSCSVDVGPGLVAGDFEVIEGYSRNGGLMCPIEPTPPPISGDCSVCDGKVTMLTLQYNGSQATHVIVEQKKDGVVFDAMVQPGEHFTFSGTDKKGTLGTEISIRVNGSVNARIHTSCSVDVGPGLVAGEFEVIEGYSRNGGLMCPIDIMPPSSGGSCDKDGHHGNHSSSDKCDKDDKSDGHDHDKDSKSDRHNKDGKSDKHDKDGK